MSVKRFSPSSFSDLNETIYKSPLDQTSQVSPNVFKAQKVLLDSMDDILDTPYFYPLNQGKNDSALYDNISIREIKRINPFFLSTHWHFLDDMTFSNFWIKYSLGLPILGLHLVEKTYHIAKNILINAFCTTYNRANEYFKFSTRYLNITKRQREILGKLLEKAWQKHKNGFKAKDIIDISVSFTLSNTKPIQCEAISFDVTLREIDKNGRVKRSNKCLYSSNDNKDPELKALYSAIDWSKFTKTYSKKELEILKSSEGKKKSMNCWDHAAIGAILHDKLLMTALLTLDGKDEFKKHDLDAEIDKLSKDTDSTNFRSVYVSTLPAEKRSKFLIDCIFACLFFKDDLEKQKNVLENYSLYIRKYTFGLKDEHSQEDAVFVINYLIDILSKQNKLPKTKVKKISVFTEDSSDRRIEKEFVDDTYGIVQLNLSTYISLDANCLTVQPIDANFLIEAYFDNAPFESFEDYDPIDEKKPSNWTLIEETKRFIEKPQGISFHFERFYQTYENNGSKMNIALIKIPLFLKYMDGKFVADKTGDYELNSAIIHTGTLNNGHYYLVYKDENQWYLKDNTKDLSNKDRLKLDNYQLNEHLKDAIYLHYENS